MDNKKIVVATSNKGKLREIKEILPDYDIVGYKDCGIDFEIEENGKTFYENAFIKAKTVSQVLNLPALADDSGLEVEALNGKPGIYSARYSKEGTDDGNIDLLLKNLKGVENRKAKFVCCLVYYKPNGDVLTATGETFGEILHEKQGQNGFGYDSVFFSEDLKTSFGVAEEKQKNAVSHRFRALEKIRRLL